MSKFEVYDLIQKISKYIGNDMMSAKPQSVISTNFDGGLNMVVQQRYEFCTPQAVIITLLVLSDQQ